MLSKLKLRGQVNSNKSLQITNFHESNVLKSFSAPKWDYVSVKSKTLNSKKDKIDIIDFKFSQLNKKIYSHNLIRYQEEKLRIEQLIKDTKAIEYFEKKILAETVYLKSLELYNSALKHDCFHDVISMDDEVKTVTVAFLPFSTSSNDVSSGLQKFEKTHLLTNGFKKFYCSRILFHKTMTVNDYDKWVLDSKS